MSKEEIFSVYVLPAVVAVITALAGFVGAQIKTLYQRYVNDRIKRDAAQTCVKAAEQLYHDLGGPEKLKKAQEGVRQMLEEKGIPISELEMNLLIESAVAEFNYGLGGKKREAVPEEPPAGTSMTEDDRGASR